MGSFACAALYAGYNRATGQHWISRQTGLDLANGVSLFPLLLLALSVFSTKLLHVVVSSNKLILAVAGAVALFAILEKRQRVGATAGHRNAADPKAVRGIDPKKEP